VGHLAAAEFLDTLRSLAYQGHLRFLDSVENLALQGLVATLGHLHSLD